MTVTESKPTSEKLLALFLALGVTTIEQYCNQDRDWFRRYHETAETIKQLLNNDSDPQLPYLVWSGLQGLEVQETFFNAWAYEIGQAGSSAHKMVEAMTGGKVSQ